MSWHTWSHWNEKQCLICKQVKLPFPTRTHKTKQILEYLHVDLWGPASVLTQSSFKNHLLSIDDFSRKIWVFLLKTKDETFITFKEWKIHIENQTNLKMKTLRIDNGLKFYNNEFNDFSKLHGILR